MARQTSVLDDLERKQFMSGARKMLLDRMRGGGRTHQEVFGRPMGAPTTTVSGRGFSAAESSAFNERNKNRALYGKYGKGGLEREKISSAERIRAMMEAGATGRTGTTDATKQKELEMRYGRGTSYGTDDRGFEYQKVGKEQAVKQGEIDAFRERTEAWKGKGMTTPRPQFIPGDSIMGTQDRMFGQNPVTGGYDVSGVPTRGNAGTNQEVPLQQGQPPGGTPLTVEEQKKWDAYRKRYGLK